MHTDCPWWWNARTTSNFGRFGPVDTLGEVVRWYVPDHAVGIVVLTTFTTVVTLSLASHDWCKVRDCPHTVDQMAKVSVYQDGARLSAVDQCPGGRT